MAVQQNQKHVIFRFVSIARCTYHIRSGLDSVMISGNSEKIAMLPRTSRQH